MERSFDLAVVGAGIVAHALAAARRGLRVAVLDREAAAIGASVRNFSFVTVTGQDAGGSWRRARRTRDVCDEVAARAGIPIEQRGLVVAARRPEAMAVLAAFKATLMGVDCALLTMAEATARLPALRADVREGALSSPHERRV
jgi:glycine/D-amino acid oxidase-like deaminating enzyme